MKVSQARMLKPNDRIMTDEGPAIVKGRAHNEHRAVNVNFHGITYIWIQTDHGVWPSNRIRG